MCGRFVSTAPPDQIAAYFSADAPEAVLEPSYNVAPTNDVYTITSDGSARHVIPMHWGLVPRWAKDPRIGNRMINARAETLAEKNAFKSAFRSRRCLIPADGFYEWVARPGQKRKQPVYFYRRDGEPLVFAGLWERWRPKDRPTEPELRSTTIITCAPNELVRPIHDRMPVLLPPERWDAWLDPCVDDLELLSSFLVPAPGSLLTVREVTTAVNDVRNKGPELIAAAAADLAEQGTPR